MDIEPRSSETPDFHMQGITAANNGDYEAANALYREALVATDGLGVAETAHILRDQGFNRVRQAASQRTSPLLDQGVMLLQSAATVESGILDTQATPEAHSEYGATLGMLGRAATVATVLFEQPDQDTEAQAAYSEAHHHHRQGHNGYYRTSNALLAARHETINGRSTKALRWLARAGFAVGWSALHDRENLKPAVRTFIRRVPDIRSREKARASVVPRP